MATPTLVLPSQWEIVKKTTLIDFEVELGDGYTQYSSVGVNPIKVEWFVKSPVLTRTKLNLVLDQLKSFAGATTFNWSPDNGVRYPLSGYFCEEWNTTPYAPNAHTIEATFTEDKASECIALAANINETTIKNMLEAMVNFFFAYTRSTQPMVANAQGVTVNAFQTVQGRGGYFPPSVGTSEGQALLIEGLLKARTYLTNAAVKLQTLNLAILYANALVSYFYLEVPPNVATERIWLPHWLVNAKEAFISKGILRSKFINSGYFDLQINFVNGVGIIPAGTPNFGEMLSDVYKVYSVGGKLLWQNVYAPLSFGTEYPVSYWVSNINLKGQNFRVYPNSLSNGGSAPITTAENAGVIKLASNFTGNLVLVYAAYTGASIAINSPLEAFPIIRPTQSNPTEKNHALDVSSWLDGAFTELFSATSNNYWNLAKNANKYSTTLAATVVNDSFLFKIDATATDPYSYPGTQLVISNNTAQGTATRNVAGWVVANINNGPELYPVAELQNFAVVLQIQNGVTIDVSLGCSVSTIMEVYLSTATSALDNTKVYTFYQPVSAGVDVTRSILPSEFIKFNNLNWWHPKIAESPIYTYKDAASSITSSIGLTLIDGANRLVSTVTMNKVGSGFAGTGFVMSNISNQPPEIYYSKTGTSVRLKITDSLAQVYYWLLPDTGANWATFKPSWETAQGTNNPLPGDGLLQNIEIVSDAIGSSTTKIWWIGSAPETLPTPCLTYKAAVVSRVDIAHTFKAGNFRGVGSPLSELKGNPGVIPFTANMIKNNTTGKYEIAAWRGTQPFSGYQDPNMWEEWGYSDRAQQVIKFLLEAQQAYTRQNNNKTIGPFAPAYNWTSWENGVNGKYNTWTFKDTIDPNSAWCGYQHRALVNVAKYWKLKPSDDKAKLIVMNFLKFIDRFYKANNWLNLPSLYPEFVDPIHTYNSIQESALVARAALYANLAGGDPVVTYRVFKKSMDFLNSEYVFTGNMSGTFTKSQPSFTNNGFTGKELFPFQHGEIMITLSEILKYKSQIKYPPCSANLT